MELSKKNEGNDTAKFISLISVQEQKSLSRIRIRTSSRNLNFISNVNDP